MVELLPDRANASVAKWFSDHPEVEYISRDRAGVHADGARQGAPQVRLGADRFHLLMNFRETVAREMNGIGPPIRENSSAGEDHEYQEQGYAAREQIVALTRRADRQAVFDEIRALYDAGKTVREIFGQLGLGRRRVERWVRRLAPPERNIMDPKPCTPAGFGEGTAQLLDHLKKGEMATKAERLLKGSGWLPEILRRSDLVPLDGDGAAEAQGALSEEVLGAAGSDEEIDLPAFLTADLPVASTAMMAAE